MRDKFDNVLLLCKFEIKYEKNKKNNFNRCSTPIYFEKIIKENQFALRQSAA